MKNSLRNIPTDNITEFNDLIYSEAKRISDKLSAFQRNLNRTNVTKSAWKMRPKEQTMRMYKSTQKQKTTTKKLWNKTKGKREQKLRKLTRQPEEINQKYYPRKTDL